MNANDLTAVGIARDALDLPEARRSGWLSTRCAGDAALLAAVDALLDAAQDEAERPLADAVDEPRDPLLGTRLGVFRLIERIGRGGMGVVYRAERDAADFAQTVAIKLIRRGFDFDDVHARFLRERRILARLSHPNLAHFVDGGVTADGRPWFALEFVDGEALTHWCDRQRLDVRSRVRIFLDVCAAVQYAHAQLVVHRDLKPGNILVDTHDTVRLLDFGIARLLESDGDTDATTEIGGRLALTPQYAAPEQFTGEGAGVAVDVYSLGVVLYELVSGALPYRLPANDAVAAQRLVREAPFLPPTQAIARGDDGAQALAAREARLALRQTGWRNYRTLVRGDLTRILEVALAKDPAQRYPTVQAFAADLQRWLAGRGLERSGTPVGYRLHLFVKRNRLAVALSAAVLLALVGGVAAVLVQAHRIERESRRSEAVRDYLVSLFENSLPGGAAGEVPGTRELLARGAQRARSELGTQPLVQADMLATLGRIHTQLGLFDDAEALLDEAIRNYENHGAGNSLPLADSLFERARVQRLRNRYDDAEASLRRALVITADRDHAREAQLRNLLGVVLSLRKQVDAGVAELHNALRIYRALEDPPGRDVANTLNDLGYVLDASGRSAQAPPFFHESLAIKRRLYGQVHVELTYPLNNLAEALRKLGRLDEAEIHSREAIQIGAQIYTTPNSTYARQLGNFALIALTRGDGFAAEPVLREALRIRRAIYKPTDTQIAFTLSNLAVALGLQGRYADAESTASEAAAILEAASGDWRPVLAAAVQTRAFARRWLNRSGESLADTQRALELVTAARGEEAAETWRARLAQAKSLRAAGRIDEADTLLQSVLAAGRRRLSGDHPELFEVEAESGALALERGHPAQARTHVDTALRIAGTRLSPRHPVLIEVRLDRAELLARSGEAAASREQLAALDEVMQARAEDDPLRRRWLQLKNAAKPAP